MGLPSGVLWSPVNIDTSRPGGFAESAFKVKCSFFSWGNTDAHNPNSNNMFDYNWGSINDSEPWYENQIYESTPGAALTDNIPLTSDAAREICGGSWRMPTQAEYQELIDNCDFVQADGSTVIDPAVTDKRVTVDGVMGIYLKSKINGKLLFFACCGQGTFNNWQYRGFLGRYLSTTYRDSRYYRSLSFMGDGVVPDTNINRFLGCPIRPVISSNT